MVRLSKWFTLDELTRSDTATRYSLNNSPIGVHMDNLRQTAQRMDEVREILNRPIIPTSGYRSPQVNRRVGGVPTSAHALGWAVDFMGNAGECQRLADALATWDQIILERSGTVIHISFDPRNRRQCLRQPGGPGTTVYQGFTA